MHRSALSSYIYTQEFLRTQEKRKDMYEVRPTAFCPSQVFLKFPKGLYNSTMREGMT